MNDKIEQFIKNAKEAFAEGNYKKALTFARKVNKKKLDWSCTEIEAKSLFELEKYQQSNFIFQKILLDNRLCQKFDILGYVGNIQQIQGESSKALLSLRASIELNSSIDNAKNMLKLSNLCLQNNLLEELEIYANRLVKWQNYYLDGQKLLIASASKSNKRSLLISRLNELALHYPYLNDKIHFYLIQKCIAINELEKAKELTVKSENKHGLLGWVVVCYADIEYNNKNYQQAITLLSDELIESLPKWIEKAYIFNIRAKCYDKKAQFPLAFNDFTESAKIAFGNIKVKNRNTNVVARYLTLPLNQKSFDYEVKPLYSHVFMIGFPRSGTTLLDTILSTQNYVITLSETDSIESVINTFINKLGYSYPKDLYKLSITEITLLRNTYFEYVDTLASQMNLANGNDKIELLVDKMPWNTIHLPLILLLFPDAKIVFSMRHPVDVCLSNFQQYFQINNETNHLILLEDCFKRYADVFNLFDYYESEFLSKVYYVKYEELISNLETVVDDLFKYLGINKINSVSDFYIHARDQITNTASKKQVIQPLYNSSTYKWKNYYQEVKPFIPLVQKYIDKFGYE
ncbi:sulfotransferase [bacterium]|nr:sulfotransferase [bacterium]